MHVFLLPGRISICRAFFHRMYILSNGTTDARPLPPPGYFFVVFVHQETFREYLALSKRFLLECEESGTVDLLPMVCRNCVRLTMFGRWWGVLLPLGVAAAVISG